MSVEKVTLNILKHEDFPIAFTQILNCTINNIRDCAALGIYTYLASKPENWNICITHLCNHFGKGRNFIKSKLKHLREIKALETIDIRDDKGRFARRETILKKYLSTVPKIQTLDNPHSGKSTTINKEILEKKEKAKRSIYNARAKNFSEPKSEPKSEPQTEPDLSLEKTNIPDVKSPPPNHKQETEMPIDPSYEYPETYYPQPPTRLQTADHNPPTADPQMKFMVNLNPDKYPWFTQYWETYPRHASKQLTLAQWVHDGCEKIGARILADVKQRITKDVSFLDGKAKNSVNYIREKIWETKIYEGKKGNKKPDNFDTSWADIDKRSILE